MRIDDAQQKTTKLLIKRLTKDLETVFLRSVDVKIETPQHFIMEIKKEIERLRAYEAIVCRGREYAQKESLTLLSAKLSKRRP
jgi:hypothetical protein